MKYIGSVESLLEKLSSRLEGFQVSQEPLNLRHAFSAFTLDVISLYCFGQEYNCLDKLDLDANRHTAIASGGELALLMKQYPWFLTITKVLPY